MQLVGLPQPRPRVRRAVLDVAAPIEDDKAHDDLHRQGPGGRPQPERREEQGDGGDAGVCDNDTDPRAKSAAQGRMHEIVRELVIGTQPDVLLRRHAFDDHQRNDGDDPDERGGDKEVDAGVPQEPHNHADAAAAADESGVSEHTTHRLRLSERDHRRFVGQPAHSHPPSVASSRGISDGPQVSSSLPARPVVTGTWPGVAGVVARLRSAGDGDRLVEGARRPANPLIRGRGPYPRVAAERARRTLADADLPQASSSSLAVSSPAPRSVLPGLLSFLSW